MGTVYEYGNHSNSGSSSSSIIDNNNYAIEHNVWRGNDLGSVTADNIDEFIETHGITKGTFDDLYLGDYFTGPDISYSKPRSTTITVTPTYRVMDIDPYWSISESTLYKKHHIIVVPDNSIGYFCNMYSTADRFLTDSGIVAMNESLEETFGDHLLEYNELLSCSYAKNIYQDSNIYADMYNVKAIPVSAHEIAPTISSGVLAYNDCGLLGQIVGFKLAYTTSANIYSSACFNNVMYLRSFTYDDSDSTYGTMYVVSTTPSWTDSYGIMHSTLGVSSWPSNSMVYNVMRPRFCLG
jgi:hypothetical protein